MSIRARYEKIAKALGVRQQDLWHITRQILPLENSFQTEPIADEEVCVVPAEPNFQLPNVFLRTKKNPACQKLVDSSRSDVEWNQTLDATLEALEEIDISAGREEFKSTKCAVDPGVLSEMVWRRYGHK